MSVTFCTFIFDKSILIKELHPENIALILVTFCELKYDNEEEIKKNCRIEINDKTIPFNYFIRFKKTGTFKIKYIFTDNITKTTCMFYECNSLTNIDLSNFNTQNVTHMSYMFYGCNSLIKKLIINN